MNPINQEDFGSSLQCCVCIYKKACEIHDAEMTPNTKTDEAKCQKIAAANKLKKSRAKDDILKSDDKTKLNNLAKESETLVICKGCKMQRYCTMAHLVEDWPMHRPFCIVLVQLQKLQKISHPLLLHGQPTSKGMLQKTIAQLKLILRVKLKRPLTMRENELIGYPAYCKVCFIFEGVTACSGCAGVAYCSEAHRLADLDYHTAQVCSTLAICCSYYKLVPPNRSKLIKNLKKGSDLRHNHLANAFREATNLKITCDPPDTLDAYQKFATCSSFSGIACICYALTNVSFAAKPDDICHVYIVGAKEKDQNRYFEEMHLKFFFLHYQDLRHLELHFISRELICNAKEMITFDLKGSTRTIVKHSHPMSFNHFAKTTTGYPTLIMMYNPDFAGISMMHEVLVKRLYPHANTQLKEYDWHKCLKEILGCYGVPICYTSLTEVQAQSDYTAAIVVARTIGVAIQRTYGFRENPYREILPLRNLCPTEHETVVYNNNYLEVIFTSIEC